jgi:DNA-binding MarR family transcriptional regulator
VENAPATGSIQLLMRLARVVYRRSTEELLGIRLKELGALAYLRDNAEASQQSLTQALHLDANSCVLVLNDLEAAGFAERRRDASDRRRHLVALTAEGRRALEKAEAAQASIEDEVLGSLGPAERAQLRELLARALEAPADQPAASAVGR